MVAQFLVRAVDDADDDEAREQMILAASYAGVGFGNAGVHLPHGMSYPVSGHVKDFHAPGYPNSHPLVPHGVSVILNAPAVFRFTAAADPARHLRAAEALGANVSRATPADAGTVLADRITWFMRTARSAERVIRGGLFCCRHSRPRRGNAAATPRDEARRRDRPGPTTSLGCSQRRWSPGESDGFPLQQKYRGTS